MKSCISIPIQTDQFLELANFLQSNNDPRDPVEVVSTAIQYWLDNADWKPELLEEVSSTIRGYQWKNLFLPQGTQIRMQYKDTYFYAGVEDDKIVYHGKPISPGSLANTIAGTSRNAWRDLWIKRPEDKEWKRADECRSKEGGGTEAYSRTRR
ncbi:hypothetical protein SAMN05216412_10314 [Nitrosospira multiformis]|uniref:Uncharacterized protein n=1 Tax=Nitrosospira multiformis TaxID=1231 RepID=A0A1I0BH55_9PROT|nr:hypothetical protein [Nitrosospira multiformis]SET06225.1 hypothetical protein SAMN05216412_10314 [Nitrosospira multiformis]